MARKDVFAGLTPGQNQKPEPEPYAGHGASKKMIQSIQEFAERARTEAGILDLDPNIIDPSPFRDRLPDDDGLAFEEFKKSVIEEGQKVPVQVRPHPASPGRYQLVYGHRRVRAAKELGLSVKAFPVEISDSELVVAQGIENGARQDLSWVERALFAKTMDDAGVKARDIYAALSIDDAALWVMRKVCRDIPLDVIESIGRASKIGRPRWVELAKAIGNREEVTDQIRKNLSAERFSDSNRRFQVALDATKIKAPAPGELQLKITASTPRGREFAKFIESRMPDLIQEFEQGER
jgi:ParB family chromosome partitioning protein